MTPGATLFEPPLAEPVRVPVGPLPVTGATRAPAPAALQCLRCQLLGRRRLTCARADVCAELPRVHALGPVLLAAWLATAVAFVVAIL